MTVPAPEQCFCGHPHEMEVGCGFCSCDLWTPAPAPGQDSPQEAVLAISAGLLYAGSQGYPRQEVEDCLALVSSLSAALEAATRERDDALEGQRLLNRQIDRHADGWAAEEERCQTAERALAEMTLERDDALRKIGKDSLTTAPSLRKKLAATESRAKAAERERDDAVAAALYACKIGTEEPSDEVFRFFQRLHDVPEIGSPTARALAAERSLEAARDALRETRTEILAWQRYGSVADYPEHRGIIAWIDAVLEPPALDASASTENKP